MKKAHAVASYFAITIITIEINVSLATTNKSTNTEVICYSSISAHL